MEFSKLGKEQEVKELMDLFQKNSEKMLEELKKGSDIIISYNKGKFIAYKELIKRI